MSITYPNPENTKTTVDISTADAYYVVVTEPGLITLRFYCDGGKFGTNEALDEIDISPKELLYVLQKHKEVYAS